jgi:hypothetical protein
MMKEKDVVKADFSVLMIMCFERLWGEGGRFCESTVMIVCL